MRKKEKMIIIYTNENENIKKNHNYYNIPHRTLCKVNNNFNASFLQQ